MYYYLFQVETDCFIPSRSKVGKLKLKKTSLPRFNLHPPTDRSIRLTARCVTAIERQNIAASPEPTENHVGAISEEMMERQTEEAGNTFPQDFIMADERDSQQHEGNRSSTIKKGKLSNLSIVIGICLFSNIWYADSETGPQNESQSHSPASVQGYAEEESEDSVQSDCYESADSFHDDDCCDEEDSDGDDELKDSSYSYDEESDSESETERSTYSRQEAIKCTRKLIDQNPMLYLGVPSNCLFVIDDICDKLALQSGHGSLSKVDIIRLILMKVKLDDSFERLGHMFGISKSRASVIFSTYAPLVSSHLKQFVYWPTREFIRARVPLAFRKRYSDVESIIDAFEIQIEKPSNVMWQAQTWSNYKHCNTFKYLISITPDGLINFISREFGGRIADDDLTVSSGFIAQLKKGALVMADRGFKNIYSALKTALCR